jgi:hypothetical protein
MEIATMKLFRFRLSALLWLMVIAAAFLGGIRYGEYRAEDRRKSVVVFTPGGDVVRSLSEAEFAKHPNMQTLATRP